MAAVRTGWIVGCSWTGRQTQVAGSRLGLFGQCLEQARTYNSQQLAQKLEQERQVKLSADRIRRLMKKWAHTATNTSKTQCQSHQASRHVKTGRAGRGTAPEIPGRVGVLSVSPVSYSYSRMGEQKRIEQTLQRFGRRISI